MTNEVAKRNGSHEVQPATQPVGQPASIPNAVEAIMSGLQQAIAKMDADDVSVELSAHQEGNRSSANFRIRAYRNGRKVMERRDDEDNLERE